MRNQFLAAAGVALVSMGGLPSTAFAMGLNFSWAGVSSCSSSPPAFTLSGVPRGTSQLAFNMVDLQNQSYSHGGGTIAHQGSKVPAGSFSYRGPCPPEGVHHEYQWTVQALDANGKIMASASASRPFPPR